MQLNDFFKQYKVLHNIKRFNMECVIEPQNLGNHGYGVGTLFYLLCKHLHVDFGSTELFLVMNHDFSETFTGDLNKKVISFSKETREKWSGIEKIMVPKHIQKFTDSEISSYLGPIQFQVFLLSDALEALLYCIMEVQKGNQHLKKALEHYRKIVDNLCTVNCWVYMMNEFLLLIKENIGE